MIELFTLLGYAFAENGPYRIWSISQNGDELTIKLVEYPNRPLMEKETVNISILNDYGIQSAQVFILNNLISPSRIIYLQEAKLRTDSRDLASALNGLLDDLENESGYTTDREEQCIEALSAVGIDRKPMN